MGKSVAQIMMTLFASYGQEGNEQRYKVYCAMFRNVNIDLLALVVKRCLRRYKKFMPTIPEMLDEFEEVKGQMTGERKLDWDEAWKEIQEKMGHDGPWRTPKWSTPEIASVVKSIGWITLCETQNSELPVIRAQMKAMYEMACKRHESDELTQNLISGTNGLETIGNITKMLLAEKGTK